LEKLIELTVIVSGSTNHKQALDEVIKSAKQDLIISAVRTLTEEQQDLLAQCMLELITDALQSECNSVVWDYRKYANNSEFLSFITEIEPV
jgi:hypothetical protein